MGSTTGFSIVPDGAIIDVAHLKTSLYLEACDRGKLFYFFILSSVKDSMMCIFCYVRLSFIALC